MRLLRGRRMTAFSVTSSRSTCAGRLWAEQRALHVSDHRRFGELDGAEIDRDLGAPVRADLGQPVPAGSVRHEPSELRRQAVALGERDEGRRRDLLALRSCPAQQRLDADRDDVLEPDDRLVVQS